MFHIFETDLSTYSWQKINRTYWKYMTWWFDLRIHLQNHRHSEGNLHIHHTEVSLCPFVINSSFLLLLLPASNCWSAFCHLQLASISRVSYQKNQRICALFYIFHLHSYFEIYPCYSMYSLFLFYCWILFHYMDIPCNRMIDFLMIEIWGGGWILQIKLPQTLMSLYEHMFHIYILALKKARYPYPWWEAWP